MKPLSLLSLLLVATAGAQEAVSFRDPAPPAVAELEAVAPVAPRDHAGLRTVAAPKPLAADAVVEDWPGFLGPRRDGRSRETRLRKQWPDGGPPRVWEMERGQGYASPAVARGRVVYGHRIGGEMHVDCLHAETGQRYWRFSYPTDYGGRYIRDGGPRATPQIAGDRVFVHGVEGMLHCLELATGRVVWKRDLRAEFEIDDGFFGVVSSPLVAAGRLFVNLGAPKGPTVAAFDVDTGRLLWGAGTEWGMSCASPVLAEVHGRSRLLVLAGGVSRPPTGGLMVLDPETGAVDCVYPFRSRVYESVSGATPLVAGDRVFLTASYGTGTAALALDADGGFEELWKRRRFGIEFATPLLVGDHLYTVHGVRERAGGIVCLDPATGDEVARTDLDWDESVGPEGARRTVSLSVGNGCMIWADGAFLCLGDTGQLLWLDCSPKGAEVLARASVFHASESWTPPVLSHGLLYLCQNNRGRFGGGPRRLLCFDLRGG